MNRLGVVACVGLTLGLGAAALAQEQRGDVAIVYTAKAKAGAEMQLDAALKKHFGWHKANKDAFAWFVWQVASGPDIGDYVAGTFAHQWKEFDARAKFDEADEGDFMANVFPSIQAIDLGYWSVLPDASHPSASQQPAAMAQVTHYYVKPDGFVRFLDAIKEMKAAVDKAGYAMTYEWYRLVSGGEGPQFVLAVDRNTWAEMAGPGKSVEQALSDTVGPQKAIAMLTALRETTRYTRSYMLRYRADLSYVPPM